MFLVKEFMKGILSLVALISSVIEKRCNYFDKLYFISSMAHTNTTHKVRHPLGFPPSASWRFWDEVEGAQISILSVH